MSIWDKCQGVQHIVQVSGTLFRLVESQEQIATLGYVDTLEEQALLEDMLEKVKPPYSSNVDGLHYLLRTPFRYPPLKWGSRFGRIDQPSIFYGANNVEVTLAESAYYRFIFWYSMDGKPIKNMLRTEHTLFTVDYRSEKGMLLHQPPFNKYKLKLCHPKNYSDSQMFGTSMRELNIDVFEYLSARDLNQGICVGLFSPQAFVQKQPYQMSQWLCELSAEEVSFKQVGQKFVNRFMYKDFLWKGKLPLPA